MNRYVSAEEEQQLFAACDAVLLPYIRHQGASGVLSRAAGAGKPVIASDEYLIGHLVRQYGMGLLFESGNVLEFQNAIVQAASPGVKNSPSGKPALKFTPKNVRATHSVPRWSPLLKQQFRCPAK